LLTVFVTISIILSLFTNTVSFFREVSIIEFLFGTEWTPRLQTRTTACSR
jgi:phosphate transport system permease protein